MNKMKNVHSPAGMGYSLTGTRLTYLTDCPKCKFGTVDKFTSKGITIFKCADCQWIWTPAKWDELKRRTAAPD